MLHTTELQNIPLPQFNSSANSTEIRVAEIKQNASAFFALNSFTLVQLILGANLLIIEDGQSKKGDAQLLAKLSKSFIEGGSLDLFLTREEVERTRDYLLRRMKHCEEERDRRNDKFNPDTYIGMKLLLLDIREWLLGEIINLGYAC